MVAALAVVLYLKPFLRTILVELCGTAERAGFWLAFSNVTLVLTPLIFALHFRSEPEERVSLIFALGTQLEGALLGLVVSVIILGMVISRFIPPVRPRVPAGPQPGAAT